MWIKRITSKILSGFRHPSRKIVILDSVVIGTEREACFLQNKKLIITGEIFPSNESAFKENLLKKQVLVQPFMTSETEILICGKYPDWSLIEEGRRKGLKIIFVDQASDLFSSFTSNFQRSEPAVHYRVPLGI